jgi:UDP-4-amino-4,6-dideoxy-N-acetyl-beta-L-altrosamine transaminase
MIPYGKQDINEEDLNAVLDVLKSDFLTQGPRISEFESVVAGFVGAEFSSAFNSATSALHVACMALGLTEGDWLWTSPNTFVASANCGLYCGAKVDFVDIDPQTYNMCPDKLYQKLKLAQKNKTLPKVVVPVHFGGQSCDMVRIHELAKEFDFRIIEDASHAIGGYYNGQAIGGCVYSDITVFSFHPVKIVTTAEGGVATTNDESLAKAMTLLKSHGITRDVSLMKQETEGPWYYEQIGLGFNYRMTELQAALGVSQMQRLKEFVQKRTDLAKRYNILLEGLPIRRQKQLTNTDSAYHLYPIEVDDACALVDRKTVFERMRLQEIGVNVHYIPVHTQPYYMGLGFKKGYMPAAEMYYKRAISLPLYPGLTYQQQDYIVDILRDSLSDPLY